MDLHHRLRRDPGWHRDACNTCGRIGHQASQCPNGSVDWLAAWGGVEPYMKAFTPAPDGLAVAAARTARAAGPGPDALAAMAAAAAAWTAGRAASGAAAGEPIPPARRPPRQTAAAAVRLPGGGFHPPGAGPGGPAPPPGAAGPPPPPLPPGWRAAWDPRKGRHYFYARSDRSRVTWAVPTEPAPP